MTVSQLYQQLDIWYPKELSCEWDHDGIMCMPQSDRAVKKILISLDATKECVQSAIDGCYDAIITHHPMLFSPIYSVSETDDLGNLLCALIKNNISVFSFHTRMDAAQDGVNDALAQTLSLVDVETVSDFIRIGNLSQPMQPVEFANHVKDALHAPCCKCAMNHLHQMIQRVAVCGGEGKDFLQDAVDAGADAYVTGNLSYHTLNSIVPPSINLVIAGHYETEQIICTQLQKRLQSMWSDLQIDIFVCNNVITI